MFGFKGFGGRKPAGPMMGALQRRMHGWFNKAQRQEGEPGTGVRPMFKGFGGKGVSPFRRPTQKPEEAAPPQKKDLNETKE